MADVIVTAFSVPLPRGNIYAVGVGNPSVVLERLRKDDPCWRGDNVYQHGVWMMRGVRPKNGLQFAWVPNHG